MTSPRGSAEEQYDATSTTVIGIALGQPAKYHTLDSSSLGE